MIGWLTPTSGETAVDFRTRANGLGLEVRYSEEFTSVILAYNGSTNLFQQTRVKVSEICGITADGASLLVDLSYDGTSAEIWYSQRMSTTGSVPQYMAQAGRTGVLLAVTAQRRNDSGEWVARLTETTYTVDGDSNEWSTTKPAASANGIEVSRQKSTRSTVWEGGVKYQIITTTITEFPFLTYAEALAKLDYSAATSTTTTTASVHRTVYTAAHPNGVSVTASATLTYVYGTNKSSSMRYIDETNGWTVTQTTENIGS